MGGVGGLVMVVIMMAVLMVAVVIRSNLIYFMLGCSICGVGFMVV